jgi:hypothetical protein
MLWTGMPFHQDAMYQTVDIQSYDKPWESSRLGFGMFSF